jgi:hypothetical protein
VVSALALLLVRHMSGSHFGMVLKVTTELSVSRHLMAHRFLLVSMK